MYSYFTDCEASQAVAATTSMSWLTGLAGKAEHLLNNIDHAAGQALHTEEGEQINPSAFPPHTTAATNDSYSPYLSQVTAEDSSQKSGSISSSASVPNNLNQLNGENNYLNQMSQSMYSSSTLSQNNSGKNTPPPSTKLTPTRPAAAAAKKSNDDELFAFLNSPDTDSGKRKKQVNKSVINGKHSRHSSTSSTNSNRNGRITESVQQSSTTADSAVTVPSISTLSSIGKM